MKNPYHNSPVVSRPSFGRSGRKDITLLHSGYPARSQIFKPLTTSQQYGPVDQLEDRCLRKAEAAGSNPARSISRFARNGHGLSRTGVTVLLPPGPRFIILVSDTGLCSAIVSHPARSQRYIFLLHNSIGLPGIDSYKLAFLQRRCNRKIHRI